MHGLSADNVGTPDTWPTLSADKHNIKIMTDSVLVTNNVGP